jgi:polyisoprenyl-phosphate glycosyltransferase
MSKISVIIPCYYNEHNIPVTAAALLAMEKSLPQHTDIEYIMVDDGSKDGTYEALLAFQKDFPTKVFVLKLAKNSGSSNAVLAGMHYATGDCCVIIAADMQDPPEIIVRLYEHWQRGYKLVLAHRSDREDGFVTRLISNTFHNLMRRYVLPQSPKGGFDLWLFDQQLKEIILKMDEKNAYIPYNFIWLGYEYVSIPYTRRKREIGKSGWTLSKKIKSFIDSFVSFSFLPLRFISIAGLTMGAFSIIYASYLLFQKFFYGINIPGWTSLMVTLLFIGAFIMVSLGIIGEYLWRTLDAARNRPNFIIDKIHEIEHK